MSKKTILILVSVVLVLVGAIGFLGVRLFLSNQDIKPNFTSIQNEDKSTTLEKSKNSQANNLAPIPSQIQQAQTNDQDSAPILEDDKEVDSILLEIENGEKSTDPSIKD